MRSGDIRLKQSQRHTAIDCPPVSSEENLLACSRSMIFTTDHLPGGGILRIGHVIDFDKHFRESKPG